MANDCIEQIDSITKFESMSNELLMELFEYYDLYSLYYSFGLLNSRIDSILYHCQLTVNLDKIKRESFIDFIRDILPKFNPKNIRSLHASNLYQIGILAYDKSLSYFTHIRSLSLNNVETDIIEYMLSCIPFSYLERVCLEKHSSRFSSRLSIVNQFLDSNRFPFLQTYIDDRGVIQNVTSKVLLKHVSLFQFSNPNDFFNFLHQSPCLKYMKVKLIFFDRKYSQTIQLSPVPAHSTLTHLNLELHARVFPRRIINIFECVPHLRYLQLNIHSWANPSLANPMFWETILSQYLIKLKRLCLDSHVSDWGRPIDPSWNSLMDREKVNEQMKKSNYWSSHQWNVTFNSVTPVRVFDEHQARFQVT